MPFSQRWFSLLLLFALLLGAFVLAPATIAAERPIRQTEIVVPFAQYEWWLMRWSNNQYECQIIIDHEGLPNTDDVYVYCGQKLYNEWLTTSACDAASSGGDISTCKGLYLHQVNYTPLEKTVLVDLPLPEVWINLSGCTLVPPENRCDQLPSLFFTAAEPLPNERVTQIQGTINGIPFVCEADTCEVPMRPTSAEGVQVEFWADSSFGDSSAHYTALIRIVDGGVPQEPGVGNWYVDVMSAQWPGEQAGSCSQAWNAFPPLGMPVGWLSTPEWPELLSTDEPYTYLAGRLITQGLVNASECPSGGLEANGYANACGLETARPEVDLWQDRFDEQIVAAARESGVPAQLMKNLFAQESQFWPGVFNNAKEYGLGQLTEMGADTLLLWNASFYNQFCPLVLDAEICDQGYAQLAAEDQATLRGALAMKASADCVDCPAGIDLSNVDFSIGLFAKTLTANCSQVAQIISNKRNVAAGTAASYEDLWRFTLANYHAGPGCLTEAFTALPKTTPLTWENIASPLDRECPGSVSYVETIAK